jgi:hypothetical protein
MACGRIGGKADDVPTSGVPTGQLSLPAVLTCPHQRIRSRLGRDTPKTPETYSFVPTVPTVPTFFYARTHKGFGDQSGQKCRSYRVSEKGVASRDGRDTRH